MPRRLASLDGAGHLDGPPEQQELLSEGGLAGVRVRNDSEGAPFPYFFDTCVAQMLNPSLCSSMDLYTFSRREDGPGLNDGNCTKPLKAGSSQLNRARRDKKERRAK